MFHGTKCDNAAYKLWCKVNYVYGSTAQWFERQARDQRVPSSVLTQCTVKLGFSHTYLYTQAVQVFVLV